MCFTDGEVSNLETNQADTSMSLTRPSEQPREDSSIGQRVLDASAASATKSKTDPEEDSLLEGTQFNCAFGRSFALFNTFNVYHLAFCFR